jgi:hypothetical protein
VLQQQMLAVLLLVIHVQHPLVTVEACSMVAYAELSKAFSAAEAAADVQLQRQAVVAKQLLQAADVQLSLTIMR